MAIFARLIASAKRRHESYPSSGMRSRADQYSRPSGVVRRMPSNGDAPADEAG